MARFDSKALHFLSFRKRFDLKRRKLQRSASLESLTRGAEYAGLLELAVYLCVGVRYGYFAESDVAATLSLACEELRPNGISDFIESVLEKTQAVAALMAADWDGAFAAAAHSVRHPNTESEIVFQSTFLMLQPVTSALSLHDFGWRLLVENDAWWQVQLSRAIRAADVLNRSIENAETSTMRLRSKDFWPIDDCVRFVGVMDELGLVIEDLDTSSPLRAPNEILQSECLQALAAAARWRLDLTEATVGARWQECVGSARTVLRQVEYSLKQRNRLGGMSRAPWTDDFIQSANAAELLWSRLTRPDGPHNQSPNRARLTMA